MIKPPRPQYFNRMASPNRTPTVRSGSYFLSPQLRPQNVGYQGNFQYNENANVLTENRFFGNDYSQKKNSRIYSFKSNEKISADNEFSRPQWQVNNLYSPQNAFMKSPRNISSNANLPMPSCKENISPRAVSNTELAKRRISFREPSPEVGNFGQKNIFPKEKASIEEMYGKNSKGFDQNQSEGMAFKLKHTAKFLALNFSRLKETDSKLLSLWKEISKFPEEKTLNFKKSEGEFHVTKPLARAPSPPARPSFNRVLPYQRESPPNTAASVQSEQFASLSYDGELSATGLREGYGTLRNSEGKKVYSGEFVKNQFHGHGSLENLSPSTTAAFSHQNFKANPQAWIRYEGQFSEGKKSGMGTLYISEGGKYIGNFLDELPHGDGCFFDSIGSLTMGKWEYGVLVKE